MGKPKKSEVEKPDVEYIAYKFIGYPDEQTCKTLYSYCGACRFFWNLLKADSDSYYKETGKRLDKTPAAYKKEPGLKWLKSIDSLALDNVRLNYKKAMNDFFDGKTNFPKFKKKGKCRTSYTTCLSNVKAPNLKLEGDMLILPKVDAPIKLNMHRDIKSGGILKRCTVSQDHMNRWYFSLVFEYPKTTDTLKQVDNTFTHIGLDMSLPKLYVDSNGDTPEFIKVYRKYEERLAFEQRKLSRMQGYRKNETQSKRYLKQKQKVAKLHSHVSNLRKDMLHKISAKLTDEYDLISVEDLNMRAVIKGLYFAKSASDNGWSMFITMLNYKQERKGHKLIKVDRFFPSSKTCGRCGHVHKELKLSDRTYECPVCGNIVDRDVQAAQNIDKEGLRIYKEMLTA